MIGSTDDTFIRAWLASRSLREVTRRMAHLLTPREARQKAALLRRCGLSLPRKPGRLAGRKPVTLTPHPEAADYFLDGRGRLAYRVGPAAPARMQDRPPAEGPWPCACCGRPAGGGWVVATGRRVRRFACGGCVGMVG